MRYPPEHKPSVRARIVEAASRALRAEGLAAVSIPKLMKQCGLTHGGFYAHFDDRDTLVAEAVVFASGETGERVLGGGTADVAAMVDAYLSAEHVAHPEIGCVLAALGTDGAKSTAPVREAFAASARGFLRAVQKKLHPRSAPATLGPDALALASRMIGAVVLARLVDDRDLADRILAAARRTPGPTG
jgi:TetR/AcrR family transcriptional repressor of nem operon